MLPPTTTTASFPADLDLLAFLDLAEEDFGIDWEIPEEQATLEVQQDGSQLEEEDYMPNLDEAREEHLDEYGELLEVLVDFGKYNSFFYCRQS